MFTREDTANVPKMNGQKLPPMKDITITEQGVRKLLLKMNPNKACGPDKLTARFLKDIGNKLSPILAVFYQATLDRGQVPLEWRKANVTAIFKKGERFKASNYRPVSLTCLCCKFMEHILVSNILAHLDLHKILVDCQQC